MRLPGPPVVCNRSDAQKYKAEEFANAVKERAETRGKRIQALHSELSDLQTAADTTRTAFDDRVLVLVLPVSFVG